MKAESEDWITAEEAGAIMGVHPVSVYGRARRGWITREDQPDASTRSGRRARFSRSEVIAIASGARPFSPRPIKPYPFQPTALECAYMAGLVDGEGCIRISCIRTKTTGYSDHYGMHVQVTNTERLVLDWIAARFGGAVRNARMQQEKRRPVREWKAHCVDALHVLQLIEPFLVLKRPHARLAIAFQERMSLGNTFGFRLSAEELAAREQMFQEMKALNRRGV